MRMWNQRLPARGSKLRP
ncbi:hypothetical protein E2C01_073125 [Portunus trituberculatus]|uniref:Uncharacterized protein n=1 Tax=Portunus trituberculatus TaxID=210409 RepID=A0A5B7I4D8_PORTR|nr:hypothetical protein [Portunus trituberculatus]